MINKIFGTIKLVFGIFSIVAGIHIFSNYGSLGGTLFSEIFSILIPFSLYGIYLLHSGWTQIRGSNYNKFILVFGIAIGVIFFVHVLTDILIGNSSFTTPKKIVLLIINFTIIIEETIRYNLRKNSIAE